MHLRSMQKGKRSMKAVVKKNHGNFQLEYTELSTPDVEAGEVLIKVKAAGICGSDMPLYYGPEEEKDYPFPLVIGHEFAGEICKIGEGVTNWQVGDRVVSDNTAYVCGKCFACGQGEYLCCPERKAFGFDYNGGFAEYVKVPAQVLRTFPNCLHKIPENVSYSHASILDPVCNAYKAVVQEAKVSAGDTVVVYGIGPLGLLSIAMAKVVGAARIVAVGTKRSAEVRMPIAKELGATDFLLSDEDNVLERIREIAGKDGVSTVIDCSAGSPSVLQEAISVVRNGGVIVKVGYTDKPIGFSLDDMARKGVTLIGHMGYNTTSWKNCLRLLSEKKINMDAVITHELPLSKWKEGFELFRNRKAAKVVLLPEEDEKC